jgi:hypothetical protein
MSLFPLVISSEAERSREIWGTIVTANSESQYPRPLGSARGDIKKAEVRL